MAGESGGRKGVILICILCNVCMYLSIVCIKKWQQNSINKKVGDSYPCKYQRDILVRASEGYLRTFRFQQKKFLWDSFLGGLAIL